jgi:hypothetical protein
MAPHGPAPEPFWRYSRYSSVCSPRGRRACRIPCGSRLWPSAMFPLFFWSDRRFSAGDAIGKISGGRTSISDLFHQWSPFRSGRTGGRPQLLTKIVLFKVARRTSPPTLAPNAKILLVLVDEALGSPRDEPKSPKRRELIGLRSRQHEPGAAAVDCGSWTRQGVPPSIVRSALSRPTSSSLTELRSAP